MSDWISRAAVLQTLQEWTYCCDAEDAIRALPAVQPGKEVMPDVPNDPKPQPDEAPASTDDAGRGCHHL